MCQGLRLLFLPTITDLHDALITKNLSCINSKTSHKLLKQIKEML